ncbi:MAG: hypothetical protein Q4B97_07965 [Lachnospiraceae bacterium]|nr:hypothetical protein [Lachnospiraceae bacterium]
MEILIVVCLAVLVSVFIVKFCIKGESEGSEKDSGALYYNEKTEDTVEKTEKSLEAFCCEVIKDEKEKIKKTEVPIKTGIVYGTKSASVPAAASSLSKKAMEVKVIYQYIPDAHGWKCSFCDGRNDESEKRCQVCGMER